MPSKVFFRILIGIFFKLIDWNFLFTFHKSVLCSTFHHHFPWIYQVESSNDFGKYWINKWLSKRSQLLLFFFFIFERERFILQLWTKINSLYFLWAAARGSLQLILLLFRLQINSSIRSVWLCCCFYLFGCVYAKK